MRARSLWFKLFSMLDPAEANKAASLAPAPAPGQLAKQGKDTFHDNDFKRLWVEQYCACRCGAAAARRALTRRLWPAAGWRKTTLCSRCFVPTSNAAIHAWKVRLCSPCIAASILNKSAFIAALASCFMSGSLSLSCVPRSRLEQDVCADAG